MEDSDRTSEYQSVRKEMTDRLLWVYGLLPVSLTTVTAYLALTLANFNLANNSWGTSMFVIVLVGIVSVFCFVTRSLLCNIYNSGSYLIVYHELDSRYQYIFRSRFRSELAMLAVSGSIGKRPSRIEDTAPTTRVVYLALVIAGGLILLAHFASQSNQIEWAPFLGAVVAFILFLFVLKWLGTVKSQMERDLLEYMQAHRIEDANKVLEEIKKRHERGARQICSAPPVTKEATE